MDTFVVLALIGIALLLAELLLSTGGVLALLGAAGLIAGGILALGAEGGAPDWVGPALITLGVLCGISFVVIGRKVIAAHREQAVRTGYEQLTGAVAEVRTPLDPEGQVWIEGSLWQARLSAGGAPLRPGARVRVEAVDGLTLRVRPEGSADVPDTEEGAG